METIEPDERHLWNNSPVISYLGKANRFPRKINNKCSACILINSTYLIIVLQILRWTLNHTFYVLKCLPPCCTDLAQFILATVTTNQDLSCDNVFFISDWLACLSSWSFSCLFFYHLQPSVWSGTSSWRASCYPAHPRLLPVNSSWGNLPFFVEVYLAF